VFQTVNITDGVKSGRVSTQLDKALIPGVKQIVKGRVTARDPNQFPWERSHRSRTLYDKIHGELVVSNTEITFVEQPIRVSIFQFINNTLSSYSSETSALLSALFLADKSLLVNSGVYELFQQGGVSHLLALSGLHIATIILLLKLLLVPLPLHKRTETVLLILLPWLMCLNPNSTIINSNL
jgi:predicted membrane metal-binding protein